MLVNILTPFRTNLLRKLFLPFSQIKLDIFASNYHLVGPSHFKKSRTVEKLLANQLNNIQALQGRLDPLRGQVVKSIKVDSITAEGKEEWLKDPKVAEYVQLYESLVKAISACQINNEWVYNIISWYNMTAFYNVLLERLFNANQDQIVYLVNALHTMKHQPMRSETELANLKENARQFYKRLSANIDISLLRKIDDILNFGLNFSKRKYFERYMQENMESLLKKLNINDPEKVEELIWLFQASILAMNDDEVIISKTEKYLLTMRIPLADKDIQRLMNAYVLKGRIQQNIYKEYIKPYIISSKMKQPKDIVESIRFLICSQTQDKELLFKLYSHFSQPNSVDQLDDKTKETLHIFTHYLKYKGYKLHIHKIAEQKLNNYCKNINKNRVNSIGKMVIEQQDKKLQKKKKSRFVNECSYLKRMDCQELPPEEMAVFEEAFAFRLAPLDLKTSKVYSKARFCCFQLEYCIHNRQNSQIMFLSSDPISYAFTSGKLTRETQIRDELLSYYGMKINHFNTQRFKTRGKMSEEEYLINRRFSSPKAQQ